MNLAPAVHVPPPPLKKRGSARSRHTHAPFSDPVCGRRAEPLRLSVIRREKGECGGGRVNQKKEKKNENDAAETKVVAERQQQRLLRSYDLRQ